MDRKTQREVAFKVMYMMEIHNDHSMELATNYLAENEISNSKASYFIDLIKAFLDNEDMINEIMNQLREDYPLSKLPLIDISLIKLAISEIYVLHEPIQVVINEVVELSKTYSDEKNYKFLNSFLGTLVRSLNA